MDFDLSDDHALLQRTVRDFARTRVAPVAAELDRTKAFPYEIVRELGERVGAAAAVLDRERDPHQAELA